ncbi:MAG: hypothetical protein NVS1B11_02280 [Terriglobales bacterium]
MLRLSFEPLWLNARGAAVESTDAPSMTPADFKTLRRLERRVPADSLAITGIETPEIKKASMPSGLLGFVPMIAGLTETNRPKLITWQATVPNSLKSNIRLGRI